MIHVEFIPSFWLVVTCKAGPTGPRAFYLHGRAPARLCFSHCFSLSLSLSLSSSLFFYGLCRTLELCGSCAPSPAHVQAVRSDQKGRNPGPGLFGCLSLSRSPSPRLCDRERTVAPTFVAPAGEVCASKPLRMHQLRLAHRRTSCKATSPNLAGLSNEHRFETAEIIRTQKMTAPCKHFHPEALPPQSFPAFSG